MEGSDQIQAPQEDTRDTDTLLRDLLAEQQQHRAEVAALRQELAARSSVPPPAPATAQSPEELHAARLEEIGQHSHYCPGCGLLYDYPRECTGKAEAPHPPIDVIPVDELQGDTSTHTPAPNTDKLG